MNIRDWLEINISKVRQTDISTASLDSEVLLADIVQKDRSWLHAHPEFELTDKQVALLNRQIARRALYEPLAYIRGKQEFYGRDFLVTSDTLTPRPETEAMIELLKEQLSSEQEALSSEKLQIIDIGTGSGCIIITAALELAQSIKHPAGCTYLGVDVSKKALEVAKKNAKKHHALVSFRHFDLLKSNLSSLFSSQGHNIILANLPYVPNQHPINQAAGHEPRIALFGGEDGLDYYRVLFEQLSRSKRSAYSGQRSGLSSTLVFTESLPSQHDTLATIAQKSGFKLTANRDFVQVFKQF